MRDQDKVRKSFGRTTGPGYHAPSAPKPKTGGRYPSRQPFGKKGRNTYNHG